MSLAERVLAGDVRAASRLMRDVEDGLAGAFDALRLLFPHTGRAYVVGITGPPGAGKSTLTDQLITRYRQQGKSVGVLAVDPTSPFSGGAILGDRIRMQAHSTDPLVFIRSLATRGNLGGLSRATADAVRIMDALGRDVILVETVGVGQDEIDIAQMAHTTVVVLIPGMGDDVQAIKAGILEVADVFAVNKADLAGADRTVRELRAMLELRHAARVPVEHDAHHRFTTSAPPGAPPSEADWEPPIVKLVALRGEGIDDLGGAIEQHQRHLDVTGERLRREQTRAGTQFVSLLRERLLRTALERLERERGRFDELAGRIARREADPYELADQMARQLAQ